MTWVRERSDEDGWKSSTVVAALLCSSRLKYTGGRSRAVLISACAQRGPVDGGARGEMIAAASGACACTERLS